MRRMFHPHPSAGLVIALIALFLALGGTTVAAVVINGANIKNGTITANKLKNGTLTGTQVKKDSLTGTQIKESSLAAVPTARNADALGGQAPSSFEPSNQWALVAGNPVGVNVLVQSGDVTAQRFGVGLYLIDAGKSVVGKPLGATLNFPSSGSVAAAPCGGSANNPGGTNCPLFNDNNHVIVRTLNTAGAAADATFYLSIGG